MNKKIAYWDPENIPFWNEQGAFIAQKNLWISIFCLMVAFSIWVLWSAVTLHLNNIGFHLSKEQLFNLIAIPGVVGATLRIVHAFIVPIFGGRNCIFLSTLLLLIPAFGVGQVVQDPSTPYSTLVLLAALCGLGGGNFSSSMANISYFFPKRQQGMALGLNAGFGNLGVSLLQLIAPWVIGINLFGMLGGSAEHWVQGTITKEVWIQNISLIWIVPIVLGSLAAFLGMDNIPIPKTSFKHQWRVFKRRHMYYTTWLYTASFGSFIGFSMAFPLLLKINFPTEEHFLSWVCLGPLLGSLIRPLGGWLADRLQSGSKVTLGAFLVMIGAVLSVLYCMTPTNKNFVGFFISFMVLFLMTGMANGSIFRMISVAFPADEKSTALGLIAAIAAYGAFLSPKVFELSIAYTSSVQWAFYGALLYYLSAVGVTWFFYLRPPENNVSRC